MNNDKGWVAIYRKIEDGRFWLEEKFTKGQAWVDLIMLASHKPNEIYVRGINVKVERGQLFWSEEALSKRWKWSREKTRNFLKDLSSHSEISRKVDNKIGVITLLNYTKYQNIGQQTIQQKNNKPDNKPDPNNTLNNDNNVNNIINNKKISKKEEKTYTDKNFTLQEVADKLLIVFNKTMNTNFSNTKVFINNLEKCLENHTPQKIAEAIGQIKYDSFWKKAGTPERIFRQSKDGQPVDYIEQLLNSKNDNYERN